MGKQVLLTTHTQKDTHTHTQTNRDKNVLLTKDAALRASVTFPAVCEEMEDISEGSELYFRWTDRQSSILPSKSEKYIVKVRKISSCLAVSYMSLSEKQRNHYFSTQRN